MFFGASIAGTHVEMLRSWKLGIAAAVRTPEEDYLVTHAGLTVDVWRQIGEPMTATTAALLLNERPDLRSEAGQERCGAMVPARP